MPNRITLPAVKMSDPRDVDIFRPSPPSNDGYLVLSLTRPELLALVRQGLELLPEAERREILADSPAWGEEIAQWQEQIRDLVIQQSGAPPLAIDGKGSDGDELMFTLAEIEQGFIYLHDQQPLSGLAADELAALRWCVAFAELRLAEGELDRDHEGDAARFGDGMTDGQREAKRAAAARPCSGDSGCPARYHQPGCPGIRECSTRWFQGGGKDPACRAQQDDEDPPTAHERIDVLYSLLSRSGALDLEVRTGSLAAAMAAIDASGARLVEAEAGNLREYVEAETSALSERLLEASEWSEKACNALKSRVEALEARWEEASRRFARTQEDHENLRRTEEELDREGDALLAKAGKEIGRRLGASSPEED